MQKQPWEGGGGVMFREGFLEEKESLEASLEG